MSIGMNLAPVNNSSSEFPFLDRFKSFGQWFIKGGSYGFDYAPASLFDANGWPTSQPTGTEFVANVNLDPVPNPAVDRYVLTYSGTASFALIGVNVVSSEPGKIVFDDVSGTLNLNLSTNSADPIHDIHIVRQDQLALYNSGEIFTPAFIDRSSNWSVLRFMDWNLTNGSDIVSWSQRGTLTDASWSNVPIEVEVALANETHSDMWLNIPAKANDDYIRQATTYVRDHLDPSLKLHLEYSNEVWNTSFAQNAYAQQQADALWGNGQSVYFGSEVFYGYRAAQMASIANQVFGADASTRLDNTVAVFTYGEGVENFIFDGISRANVGSVQSLFKDYAVTTYFGDALSAFGTQADLANDKGTILGWARSGAAGLDAAFQQLNHGNLLSGDYSLDWLIQYYNYQGQVAHANGLNLVAYEGGLSSYFFTWGADQAEVVDFIKRIEADPRMGDLYARMASDFAAAGGTEMTVFNDTGPTGIFGPWGTTDNIYDTSPRYEALVAASGRVTGISTAASSYTMADTDFQLTYNGSGNFTGTGNASANIITAGDAGSHLYGLGGNDTLIGGAANDYLDGGTGADRMVGGTGDDIYIVDDAGDIVVEQPNGGTDEVRTTLASYTLSDNVENLTFTDTGSFTATGNALDNVITGGTGNDFIDGGVGADRMVGGAGDDIYIVDNAGDVVVELPDEGNDEVRTTLATYTLPANVEKLTYTGTGTFTGMGNGLDNVITGGNGGNQLYGGAGSDTLTGGTGADYLDGGSGTDRMVGGAGDDIYIVDNTGDVVVELAGEGNDEVRTTLATYTLPANVEKLTFIGTGNFTGIGNALDNVITGGTGDDWLDGGAGNDTLIGGAGNDTYVVASVGDVLVEQANGGIDTVRTSLATFTLGANFENLTYTGSGAFSGTGNELDNVITGSATAPNKLYGDAGNDTLIGGAGADYLDGGAGIDTMTGGAGNDVYIVHDSGDVVVELTNGGVDEVRSYASSYMLSANVENLTFVGTGDFTGTGNASDNLITGGTGNDALYGGAGNDTLLGGAGNDYLDGGTGADKMIGGTGDDTYIVDNSGDKVLESPNEGYDTVIASISYILPANVEKLILSGTADLDGQGNALANVIVGNAGNNHIYGYAGDDNIDGGAGNDVIDGGDGNDTIIGGAGQDILTGGNGADTFVFRPGDLASDLAHADQITDFSHAEGDKLDFSALRLSPGTALSFMGTAAFDHHAGEVRSVASGSNFDVSIDLDGDGVADIHLLVTSRTGTLLSSDFIL